MTADVFVQRALEVAEQHPLPTGTLQPLGCPCGEDFRRSYGEEHWRDMRAANVAHHYAMLAAAWAEMQQPSVTLHRDDTTTAAEDWDLRSEPFRAPTS